MRITFQTIKQFQKPKEEEWIFGYYITRRISKYFTFVILKLFPKINPNVITLFAFIFGIAGTVLLSFPNDFLWIVGSLLCFSFFIWDCVDGEIARIRKKTSEFGKYLDKFFHPLFNTFFLGFAGIGLYFYTHFVWILYLALCAVAFTTLSEIIQSLRGEKFIDYGWKSQNIFVKFLKTFATFQAFIFLLIFVSIGDFFLRSFYLRTSFIILGYLGVILKGLKKEIKFLNSFRHQ